MNPSRNGPVSQLPLAPISKGSAKGFVELLATLFGMRDDTGHKLREVGEIIRFPIRFRRPLTWIPNAIIENWTFEWVQITSPRVLRELYTRVGDDVDHEATKGWVRPMMGANAPFVIDGPAHVKIRQALVSELTETKVEQYRELSVEVLDRMIDEILLDTPMTLHHFFAAFAQEVILRATFGLEDQDEIDELRFWLNRGTQYAFANRLRLLTGLFLWPALRPFRDGGDSIPAVPFRTANRIRRHADRMLHRKIDELRARPNDSIASRLIARSSQDPFWTDKILRDTLATLGCEEARNRIWR